MYRSVLTHELGHVAYQDRPTGHGHFDQRQERRANRFALRLLFTDQEFRNAYDWCGPPASPHSQTNSNAHSTMFSCT